MKVVTQNIKVDFENDEKFTLNTARCILQSFINIMKDHNCNDAYFEQFGVSYDVKNLQDAVDLLEAFSDVDNPTIE